MYLLFAYMIYNLLHNAINIRVNITNMQQTVPDGAFTRAVHTST